MKQYFKFREKSSKVIPTCERCGASLLAGKDQCDKCTTKNKSAAINSSLSVQLGQPTDGSRSSMTLPEHMPHLQPVQELDRKLGRTPDRVTDQVTDQVDPWKQVKPASFWKRVLAATIDVVVMNTISFLVAMMFGFPLVYYIIAGRCKHVDQVLGFSTTTMPTGAEGRLLLFLALGAAIIFGCIVWAFPPFYHAALERSKFRGSLGKRLLGLVVTSRTGAPMSIESILWRVGVQEVALVAIYALLSGLLQIVFMFLGPDASQFKSIAEVVSLLLYLSSFIFFACMPLMKGGKQAMLDAAVGRLVVDGKTFNQQSFIDAAAHENEQPIFFDRLATKMKPVGKIFYWIAVVILGLCIPIIFFGDLVAIAKVLFVYGSVITIWERLSAKLKSFIFRRVFCSFLAVWLCASFLALAGVNYRIISSVADVNSHLDQAFQLEKDGQPRQSAKILAELKKDDLDILTLFQLFSQWDLLFGPLKEHSVDLGRKAAVGDPARGLAFEGKAVACNFERHLTILRLRNSFSQRFGGKLLSDAEIANGKNALEAERDQAEDLFVKAMGSTNDSRVQQSIGECMLPLHCFTRTNEAIDKAIVKNPKAAGLFECRASSCLDQSNDAAERNPNLAAQLEQQAKAFSSRAAKLRAQEAKEESADGKAKKQAHHSRTSEK